MTKSGFSDKIDLDIQMFAESDMFKQDSNSLKRGINSYKKRILAHQEKLEHPEIHIADWENKDVREQDGLKKHWQKEIKNFQTSIDDRVAELKKRGDYDE